MTPSPTPPTEPAEVKFVALDLSPEDSGEHVLYLAVEMSDGTYKKVVRTGINTGCAYIGGWVPGDPADYVTIEPIQANTCEEVAELLLAISAIDERPEITGSIECNLIQDQCAISEGNIVSLLKLHARTIELTLYYNEVPGSNVYQIGIDELDIVELPLS